MSFDQADFELRCEWGSAGVARLAPISDAVVLDHDAVAPRLRRGAFTASREA